MSTHSYRVMFFKTLTNSYGKVFKVCQRTIDVFSARSPESAVEQAKRRFEQSEDIRDWRIHADYFQVDALSGPLDDFRGAEYRAPALVRPSQGQPASSGSSAMPMVRSSRPPHPPGAIVRRFHRPKEKLVPRYLGCVETSLRGQSQFELAGHQLHDGLEIAG